MKHILTFLICAGLAHAALPATAVWEIRASATAGNVNGGGFNAARGGTDYTLQNTAQLTGTDGASTTTSTTFTSTSVTFTSAMVGNYIHITTAGTGAQCVVGWYEVVTYTDANNVVLDRAPSGGTGCVAATWYLGGAMSLGSTLDDDMLEATVPGNVFYIKAGNYTFGETISISSAGTTAANISIVGYNATRGDNPTGETRPFINAGTNAVTLAPSWNLSFVSLSGSASSLLSVGADSIIRHCKLVNVSTTAARSAIYSATTDALLYGVEAISYRGNAASLNGRTTVYGSYFHDSDVGILVTGSTSMVFIANTIVADNVTYGLRLAASATSANVFVNNSTFYGTENTTGTGISLVTASVNTKVLNSIIYGFTTGIAHEDAANDGHEAYVAYYNNDTPRSNWMTGIGAVTTDPVFAAVAQLTGATATISGSVLTQSGAFATVTDGVDFVYIVSGTGVTAGKYKITSHDTNTITLDIAPGNSAAGDVVWQITTGHNFAVGANMKALAFPGVFPGGLTTGYLDIGAVQRIEPAAGGVSGGSFPYVQ